MAGREVIAFNKSFTTADVTGGVVETVRRLFATVDADHAAI